VQVSDVPFAIYDAFTDVPYSGSQAAIVLNASDIPAAKRAQIAREVGAPATAFVERVEGAQVQVQFFSTVMELPMCGHGTVCLVTRLVELGLLGPRREGWQQAFLGLPKGDAKVEFRRTSRDRVEVMLDVAPARFEPALVDMGELASLLGIEQSDLSDSLPVEVARADFVHLCLPMRNLEAMKAIQPDFAALASFCNANGLETVAAFSIEASSPDYDLHVRDFCPAVGVAESAAAGTTNAALAAYLLRNNCVEADETGHLALRAEQGIELGRPSQVTTLIETSGTKISRLQVGGIASRVAEGVLNVAQ